MVEPYNMETKSGKASSPILTEEAYGEGRIARRQLAIIEEKLDTCQLLTDEEQEWVWMNSHWKNYQGLKTELERIGRPRSFADYEKRFPPLAGPGQMDRETYDYYCQLEKMFAPPKPRNQHQLGTWELTLTYSPKWFQDDEEAQAAFKKAEQRLLKYYADELELYRSVGEFTQDGRAHLHILYRTRSGGKFTDKNLRRAYPRWNPKVKVGKGVQGGHHAPCVSQSSYAGYIEKDLEKAWHVFDIATNANDSSSSETA